MNSPVESVGGTRESAREVRSPGLTRLAAALTLTVCAACGGGSPTTPAPVIVTPDPLRLVCPVGIEVESSAGEPVQVEYAPPKATGGFTPVAVTCKPEPGAELAVGAHTVACEARDSIDHTETCTFAVTVKAPPRLRFTTFLAFGDSITAGTVAPPAFWPLRVAPQSYPFKLQQLLAVHYHIQTITVGNAGQEGEVAVDGVDRLPSELRSQRPEVLLLMEGANDVTLSRREALDQAILALERMVREARDEGVTVCLATLPPQRPGGPRDEAARLIPEFNDRVRALAQREDAVLVDVHAVMKNDLSLIGDDDLHPTEHGYEVMAQIFFDTIRVAFEVTSNPFQVW